MKKSGFVILAILSLSFLISASQLTSALSDLVPRDLRVVYVNPVSNTFCEVSLAGKIRNQGDSSTVFNYSVRWILDGSTAATYLNRPALPSNGTDTLPNFIFGTPVGSHLAQLEADYTRVINESNENNNIAPLNFTCTGTAGNQTHLACVNQACVVVAGGGANLCANNAQCQNSTNQTRLTCINNMCTRVNGTGSNTCSPQGSVCGTTNQTHLECRNNTCSIVNGSGNNLCSPQGSTCGTTNQTRRVCSTNYTCITVPGNGTNLCNTNNDCYPVTNKYLSPKAKNFNFFSFIKRIFSRS